MESAKDASQFLCLDVVAGYCRIPRVYRVLGFQRFTVLGFEGWGFRANLHQLEPRFWLLGYHAGFDIGLYIEAIPSGWF